MRPCGKWLVMDKTSLDRVHRIMYISPGGIGNLVLALPALRALRARFPLAGITLLTAEPAVEHILDGEGLIDDAVCLDRSHFQGPWALWQVLRLLRLRRFDVGLTAGTVEPLSAGLLLLAAGVPCRVGENIGGRGFLYTTCAPYSLLCHERDGALNIVEALGLDPVDLVPHLQLSAKENLAAETFLRAHGWQSGEKLFGFHAGSGGSPQKRWPRECFVQVARSLMAQGAKVLLTSGPAERDWVLGLAETLGSGVINTDGLLSIRETAAVVAHCDLFISNDSGIAHIAAAVGTALVVLFGPTDPARVAPKGKNRVCVVQPAGLGRRMSTITVAQVLEAAASLRDGATPL